MNVDELDAGELTVSRLRDIERTSATFGMGVKSGRVYIVNEAHGLRRDAIRQLLVMLERIPGHCLWVFTTTSDAQESLFEDNEDAGPLLSRCVRIALSRQALCKPFAARLREIAGAENLDGRPIEAYERLVKDSGNNFRAALQAIESGAMLGGE
jgi:DNA polymerase III delta prime subunit